MTEDVFKFDEAEHRYTLNGVRLPSITWILKKRGFINDAFFDEASRVRGTAVHKACHFLVENDLNWETVHPGIISRVKQFKAFLEDISPFTIMHAEAPVYSKIYGFAGTPDYVFETRGEIWIPDVKSGKSGFSAKLQTAAQEILVREWVPITARVKRFALELPETGKYKLIPHEDRGDRDMFLNALAMTQRQINEKELSLDD
jgi:hypothetical protein